MSDSWKLTLPCTLAEAQALEGEIMPLAMLDSPPVLMTSEAVLDDPEAWRLDAYFDAEPDAETIALIQSLVPSAGQAKPVIEKLAIR